MPQLSWVILVRSSSPETYNEHPSFFVFLLQMGSFTVCCQAAGRVRLSSRWRFFTVAPSSWDSISSNLLQMVSSCKILHHFHKQCLHWRSRNVFSDEGNFTFTFFGKFHLNRCNNRDVAAASRAAPAQNGASAYGYPSPCVMNGYGPAPPAPPGYTYQPPVQANGFYPGPAAPPGNMGYPYPAAAAGKELTQPNNFCDASVNIILFFFKVLSS